MVGRKGFLASGCVPAHCGADAADDSDTAPLIDAKRPHTRPPSTNNPASRLLRRGLLGR